MIKKILIITLVALVVISTGCNKYLDVNPKSTLSEEQLFESEVGFQQALIGVYSQLASRNLYGDNLSMGFASALAQNYAVAGALAPFVQTRALAYETAEVQEYTNAIWNAAYTSIAGVNKIIINTEEKRAVLSTANYSLVRGEALALRAFLHFDILRMFGPEYTAGMGRKAIPYKKTVDEYAVVPSVTEEVVSLALADLKEAEDLLKPYDPIITGSTSRSSKLNYYAVKGLEARIKLYAGDNAGAFAAAQAVVNAGIYPFVTSARASAAAATRDRLYLTEQVFCVRVRNLLDWVNNYFRFNISTSIKLTLTAANFNTLYETAAGGGTDFRYVYRIEQDGGSPFPSKFWQTAQSNTLDSAKLDQLVPAIRLSEMYYILAESAPTMAEGIGYLNTIRRNRGLADLATSITPTVFANEITKEYQKEFYAEGQLFYYYKRKKIVRMQFMSTNIALTKYVLPIPQSELEFNPNYN